MRNWRERKKMYIYLVGVGARSSLIVSFSCDEWMNWVSIFFIIISMWIKKNDAEQVRCCIVVVRQFNLSRCDIATDKCRLVYMRDKLQRTES